MNRVRLALNNVPDSLRERIEVANEAREPREPPSIDPATGKLRAPPCPTNGVQEAYCNAPYAMRPGWRVTYIVRGEARERVYECTNQIEALTRLASDEPEAYQIAATYEEIPIET